MPPHAKAVAKTLRTKKAGSLLASQMMADALNEQKKLMRANIKNLSKQMKKMKRQARSLKAKANKTDMSELMQIIVVKAAQIQSEKKEEEGSGGSSSSSDAWTPKSPKEAFDTITALLSDADKQSVEEFAAALRKKAATDPTDE